MRMLFYRVKIIKMKEKMRELIMLIDIYDEEVVWVHSVWCIITDKEVARIISKDFWFIKWLVQNNMIDMKKVKKWEIMIWCDDVDNTIIKLAISENPIEDLISYLK